MTSEPAHGRLTWKTQLRGALLPLLRAELNPGFDAPWNTSQHQVLVLPGYRMYNAKLFFARFAPVERAIRFGFWVEKGLTTGRPRDPAWRMTRSWDWHRLTGGLQRGDISLDDLHLGVDGLEAKASTWGPHDIVWRRGATGHLARVSGSQSVRTDFADMVAALAGWPSDRWCDFFVSTTIPEADAMAAPREAAERMMKAFRALYPLLEKTACPARSPMSRKRTPCAARPNSSPTGAAQHPTVRLKYADQLAEIDAEIAPLILEVWRAGIHTVSSSQAKPEGWIWILFEAQDLTTFLDIAIGRDRCRRGSMADRATTGYGRGWRRGSHRWRYQLLVHEWGCTCPRRRGSPPEPATFVMLVAVHIPREDVSAILGRFMADNRVWRSAPDRARRTVREPSAEPA